MIQRTLRYMGLAPRKREDQVIGADLVFVAQDISELIKELTKAQEDILALASAGGLSDGDKGDITVSAGGVTWTIDPDVVSFSKMQNIATDRLLGRDTAGSGDVEEISLGNGLEFSGAGAVQTKQQMSVTVDAAGIKLSGDSAAPGNLKLYGTDGAGTKGWYTQPTTGVSDGDYGDVVVSGGGTQMTEKPRANRLFNYLNLG